MSSGATRAVNLAAAIDDSRFGAYQKLVVAATAIMIALVFTCLAVVRHHIPGTRDRRTRANPAERVEITAIGGRLLVFRDPRSSPSRGAPQMGAVPDYLEPLRGYRVWHVRHGTELESLCGTAWPPFEQLEARPCMALQASDVTAGRIACDGPPCVDHWTCGLRCGIYAFSTPDRVLGAIRHESFLLRRSPLVIGEVWLWGRVARHEYGYRAQFAYPAKFIGGLGCDPLHLALVYGVPYEEDTSCTSVCNSVTSWWSHSGIPFPAGPARRPAAAAAATSTLPAVWSAPSRQLPISTEARPPRSLSVVWKRRHVAVARWRAELRRIYTGIRGSRAG